MSYAGIRTALQTRLAAVPGTGNVFTFLQWTLDDVDAPGFAEFLHDLADSTEQVVNFVQFTRKSIRDERKAASQVLRKHEMELNCFYSAVDADATELVFQDWLEAVLDSLEDQATRGLGLQGVVMQTPSVSTVEFMKYGSVLCHYAIVGLTIHEELQH